MGESWGAESAQAGSKTKKGISKKIKVGRKEGENILNKGAYRRLKDEARAGLLKVFKIKMITHNLKS